MQCTEKCLFYLSHYPQYMIKEKPIEARKLSEEEEQVYRKRTSKKRENPLHEDINKRPKQNVC